MRKLQVKVEYISSPKNKTINLGKGTILITSDAEERDEEMLAKPLSTFCQDGVMLR